MSTLGPVNQQWFKDRLALRDVSQRRLARHLNLEPSAVTLTLQGRRRMQMDEAVEIARFLGTSVEEVLKNAGIPLKDNTSVVPLVGNIDERSEVHLGDTIRMVEVSARVPKGTVAVILSNGMADGGIAFFKPSESIEADAIGRLSIVRMDNGPTLFCAVNRGLEPGKFDLKTSDGSINDAVLRSATPVLWIRP